MNATSHVQFERPTLKRRPRNHRRPAAGRRHTRPGCTAVTLGRETSTLVFKAVREGACVNCGKSYVGERVSHQILAAAELAARSGVQVDVWGIR